MILALSLQERVKIYIYESLYILVIKKPLDVIPILWFNLGDREGHVHFCEQKKDIKHIYYVGSSQPFLCF